MKNVHMLMFIAIFVLLFSVIAWRRLEWAVMFLIAALPSYLVRFDVAGIPLTLLEAMIITVFCVWVWQDRQFISEHFKSFFGKKKRPSLVNDYPFKAELILVLIVSFSGIIVAKFSDASLGIWKAYFFEPILLYIAVINLLARKQEKKYELILWPLLVSALGVSLLAIFQKFTGLLIGNPMWAAEETRRVVSFFGYPNAVGLYLAPLALVFLGWLKKSHEDKEGAAYQIAIGSGFLLSVISIVFARSVGALFGISAGVIFFGLMASRKSRLATLVVLVAAVSGILSFTPYRQSAYEYLTLNDFSGQIRKSQWDETWKMLKDGRITTGAGLANYQASVAPYHHEGIWIKDVFDPDWLKKVRASADFRKKAWQPLEIYLYPHNIVLNFWAELGISGAVLFMWLIGRYIYSGIKSWQAGLKQGSRDYLILGLLGAMIAIVVQGLVDVPYFKNDLSVMFWLLVAVVGFKEISLKEKKKAA